MTTALLIRDIAACSLQAGVMIAAGAAAWRVLRMRQPLATLNYWRALLFLCLLMPFCQPWLLPTVLPIEQSPLAVGAVPQTAASAPQLALPAIMAPVPFAWSDVLLICLGAGVVVRSFWLALGAYKLHRLRRTATRLEPAPAALRSAQSRIGAHAEVYVSDDIAGPITFGFRRPVVMLPPAVLSMENELQDAIFSHELLHIRRRDWPQVIAEEAVRTIVWFHPGIWWVINRIQLSREHVVDQAVIGLTHARDQYVEALVAVAVSRGSGTLVPAPLFLRRRFLKSRVAQILQETTMTTRRLIASVTASACALTLAAVLAVRAFPIEARSAQPQIEDQASSSAPIQIVSGGQHLLHGALPDYPKRALEQRVEGDVVLNVTIDELGEVSDVSVISGPAELRRAALESVLQWHYAREAMHSTSAHVALRFQLAEAAEALARSESEGKNSALDVELRAMAEDGFAKVVNKLQSGESSAELEALIERYKVQQTDYERALRQGEAALQQNVTTNAEVAGLRDKLIQTEMELSRMREKLREARELLAAAPILREVRVERVDLETVKTIRERAGIRIGDALTEDVLKRLRDVAVSIDSHLLIVFHPDRGLLMISTP